MQTVAGNPNSIMYLNNCVGAISKEVGIVRDEVSQCLITDYWQVSLRWFVFFELDFRWDGRNGWRRALVSIWEVSPMR